MLVNSQVQIWIAMICLMLGKNSKFIVKRPN